MKLGLDRLARHARRGLLLARGAEDVFAMVRAGTRHGVSPTAGGGSSRWSLRPRRRTALLAGASEAGVRRSCWARPCSRGAGLRRRDRRDGPSGRAHRRQLRGTRLLRSTNGELAGAGSPLAGGGGCVRRRRTAAPGPAVAATRSIGPLRARPRPRRASARARPGIAAGRSRLALGTSPRRASAPAERAPEPVPATATEPDRGHPRCWAPDGATSFFPRPSPSPNCSFRPARQLVRTSLGPPARHAPQPVRLRPGAVASTAGTLAWPAADAEPALEAWRRGRRQRGSSVLTAARIGAAEVTRRRRRPGRSVGRGSACSSALRDLAPVLDTARRRWTRACSPTPARPGRRFGTLHPGHPSAITR